MNSIKVQPDEHPQAVDVATKVVSDVHYPQFMSVDDNGNEISKDNPFSTIEMEHGQIHKGQAFSVSGKVTGIASGASLLMLARTGATKAVHWRAAGVTVKDGPIDINFYEAPDISADGSPVVIRNKKRSSTNISELLVFSGPTIGVGGNGDHLEYGYIPDASGGGGGGGRSAGGAIERIGGEWILAAETDYLVSITNNSGSLLDLGYTFFWYEL